MPENTMPEPESRESSETAGLEPPTLCVGDRVQVIALPAFVKTAEPMPMLRSPSVLSVGDVGTLLDRRPGGYWGVRFAAAAYLMEAQYLAKVETDPGETAPSPSV